MPSFSTTSYSLFSVVMVGKPIFFTTRCLLSSMDHPKGQVRLAGCSFLLRDPQRERERDRGEPAIVEPAESFLWFYQRGLTWFWKKPSHLFLLRFTFKTGQKPGKQAKKMAPCLSFPGTPRTNPKKETETRKKESETREHETQTHELLSEVCENKIEI